MGASASLLSGFHPETNGQTESTNQTLERTLCCLVSSNPTTWSEQLVSAEYAYNTLQNASAVVPRTGERRWGSFVAQFNHQCRATQRRVCASLQQAVAQQKLYADQHHRPAPKYLVGQRVWVSTKDLPLRVESCKLVPCFVGPSRSFEGLTPSLFTFCPPVHEDSPLVSCLLPQASLLQSTGTSGKATASTQVGWGSTSVHGSADIEQSLYGTWGSVPCGLGGIWSWCAWVPARDILDPALVPDLGFSPPLACWLHWNIRCHSLEGVSCEGTQSSAL